MANEKAGGIGNPAYINSQQNFGGLRNPGYTTDMSGNPRLAYHYGGQYSHEQDREGSAGDPEVMWDPDLIPEDYLGLAICATICCPCIGAIAIFKSLKVRDALTMEDYEKAIKESNFSRNMSIIAIVIFLVLFVFIVFIAVIILVVSAKNYQTNY